jgi:hypothetical protein
VSDGVQSAITEKFPGTIYCPVETSGDGRVNFYSRVQMYLFKAKQSALAEFDRACEENGVTREQVKAFLDYNPRFSSPLHKAPHRYSGTAADLVAEVAPYITKSRWERLKETMTGSARRSVKTAQSAPHMVIKMVRGAVEAAPEIASRVKEDIIMLQETRKASKAKKAAAPQAQASV